MSIYLESANSAGHAQEAHSADFCPLNNKLGGRTPFTHPNCSRTSRPLTSVTRKEEFYLLSGLVVAILGCIAAWLALFQSPRLGQVAATDSPKPHLSQPESSATSGTSPEVPHVRIPAEPAFPALTGRWKGTRRTDDGRLWYDTWDIQQLGRTVRGRIHITAGSDPEYFVVKEVEGTVVGDHLLFSEPRFLLRHSGPFSDWCLSTGDLTFDPRSVDALHGFLGPGRAEPACPPSVTGEISLERR